MTTLSDRELKSVTAATVTKDLSVVTAGMLSPLVILQATSGRVITGNCRRSPDAKHRGGISDWTVVCRLTVPT